MNGEYFVGPHSLGGGKLYPVIIPKELVIQKFVQVTEHKASLCIMPIKNRVSVKSHAQVSVIHEYGSQHVRFVIEISVQIYFIVLASDYGVINLGVIDLQPPGEVGVDSVELAGRISSVLKFIVLERLG